MPSIKKVYGSKWLKVADIPKAGLEYAIKRARIQKFDLNGEEQIKVTLYPANQKLKPAILNKTNAEAAALVIGSDDTEDWAGSIIRFKREWGDSFGGKKEWLLRIDVPAELLPDPADESDDVDPDDLNELPDDGMSDDGVDSSDDPE